MCTRMTAALGSNYCLPWRPITINGRVIAPYLGCRHTYLSCHTSLSAHPCLLNLVVHPLSIKSCDVFVESGSCTSPLFNHPSPCPYIMHASHEAETSSSSLP